jgi:hypothetical protein
VPKLRDPLKFTVNLNVAFRTDKLQRRVTRKLNSLLPFGSRKPSHVRLP